MSHPSIETLFLVARGDADAEVTRHLSACPDCATKLRRLEGGAVLIREAKRSMPDLSWAHLDDVMAREAESAARQMRLAPPRPQRAWLRPLTFGLTFATAAAVAVVALRRAPEAPAPIARSTPTRAPTVTPTRAPFEGSVLLATAGVTWRAEGGAAGPLSGAAALREGGRVETGPSGRALVAVQPGWKLDLRAGTTASLTRMRQGEAVVALAQGEALVARAEGGEATSVAVEANGWTVRSDGAAITRHGVDVVRVVVLSGRAEVSREGARPMQFTGPVSLELTLGGAANIQPAEARDANALDLSAFRAEGTLFNLPATDPAAVISLGDAVLPRGVEAIRLAGPTTLSARVGRAVYTLEIGSGRVLAWTRVNNTVASNAPAMNRPRVVPPTALAPPEAPDPGLTPAQIAGVSRAAGMRIRHCFSTCVERNQCAPDQGQVRIQIQPDGRASLGAIPASIEGARRCLENEMQVFRGAQSDAPYDLAIGFNTQR